MMNNPIEIFFSYAHEDESLMDDVRRQLIVFERNGRILKWHDRQIPPGSNWRGQIDERLNAAQIVLLFISPHFIESRYCYEIEGKAALRRRDSGEAEVIPIILRPCAWQETPFGMLQALPHDAVPVSRWLDRDEACLNVATGVMDAVDRVIERRENPSTPSEVETHTPRKTTTTPSQTVPTITDRLQTTWDRYIDAIHRFIALNTSVIVGLVVVASFLPKRRGAGDATANLASKSHLFWGLVLLMVSLICLIMVRIWAQQFMEYEILQPRDAVEKYFGGRIHFTQSYGLSESGRRWQFVVVRLYTILAPLSFLAGLSLSLLFLYRNLQ